MMKRMFVMAAMAAATCLVLMGVAFGQGTPAVPATTECKKSDECGDPTPVCDVAKVCRARTPAEEAAKIRKDKQEATKAAIEAAEGALATAKAECSKDATKCDSPTATPIRSAEQRLAEAKAASKVGAGAATAVAGTCYDSRVRACSRQPVKGTCSGSAAIMRCAGTLAEIDPLKGGGDPGASEARLGRLESTVEGHEKRINAVEGTQTALLDEADRTATKADEAYAAAVSDDVRDERSADAPPAPAGGSAGDVDADKLSGCIGAKSRFLKRDKRLKDDTARQEAANQWCLASLTK